MDYSDNTLESLSNGWLNAADRHLRLPRFQRPMNDIGARDENIQNLHQGSSMHMSRLRGIKQLPRVPVLVLGETQNTTENLKNKNGNIENQKNKKRGASTEKPENENSAKNTRRIRNIPTVSIHKYIHKTCTKKNEALPASCNAAPRRTYTPS